MRLQQGWGQAHLELVCFESVVEFGNAASSALAGDFLAQQPNPLCLLAIALRSEGAASLRPKLDHACFRLPVSSLALTPGSSQRADSSKINFMYLFCYQNILSPSKNCPFSSFLPWPPLKTLDFLLSKLDFFTFYLESSHTWIDAYVTQFSTI